MSTSDRAAEVARFVVELARRPVHRTAAWKLGIVASGGEIVIGARSAARTELGLSTYLLDALSETVFGAVMVCAGVIALFGQSKSVVHLGYVLVALVVVPVSFALAWRRRAGRTTEAGTSAALLRLAVTAAALCELRLAQPGHTSLLLFLLLAAAWAVTEPAIRVARRRGWDGVPTRVAMCSAPVLMLIAALPFVPSSALKPEDIVLAGACAVAVASLLTVPVAVPRAWRRTVDAGVIALCTLVVFSVGPLPLVLALNQNYFLGPANDVLHGHPMLVSTFSQYGVGLIDAIAAFYKLFPIGYGSFMLLLSALTSVLFAAIYVVLRLSTRSQVIAIAGLVVAVVLDVFGQLDFYTYFPSTGVLRFGLPWLVILLSVAGARAEQRARVFDGLLLATVAVAATWSGETGVYCLGAACAIACLRAATRERPWRLRLRFAAADIARLGGASVSGVLLFTLAIRGATGTWPDWGGYINFVSLYTVGTLGALPIAGWSPGLALGAMYACSAVTIVAIAVARPDVVRDHQPAFYATAGLTAFGALVFTYFLGRAAPNNLIHVSPPAIALGFVWVGIARTTIPDRRVVAIVTGVVIFIGSLVVFAERGNAELKYPTTALAAVLGRSAGIATELRSLGHNPVVEPEAAHVAGFVSSLGRRRDTLTIILYPSVESEALLRLDRANAVGTSNPCQESLTSLGTARVATEIRALRPGGMLVTSSSPADAGTLLPIQQYALALIRSRFTPHRIGADGHGLDAYVMSAPGPAGVHPTAAPAPVQGPFGCA
jgi:hypothetical protein